MDYVRIHGVPVGKVGQVHSAAEVFSWGVSVLGCQLAEVSVKCSAKSSGGGMEPSSHLQGYHITADSSTSTLGVSSFPPPLF